MKEQESLESLSLQALFMRAHKIYMGKCYRQMMELNLHPGQIPILLMLAEKDELNQKEIAARLCVKPPTVNVMLQRMEKAGLTGRRTDPEDQRATKIFLTEKGMELGGRVLNVIKENDKLMFQGFTETEQCLLHRFLAQIVRNIEKIPEQLPVNLLEKENAASD